MSGQTAYWKSFKATDGDGNEHELDVFVSRGQTPLRGMPTAFHGIPEIRTKDGLDVNALGGGDYEVVKTGLKLHSDDPDAP